MLLNKHLSVSQRFAQSISIVLLICTVITVGALKLPVGWFFLGLGSLNTLLFCDKQFRKDIIIIYGCLALLGSTSITTDIGYVHGGIMMFALFLSIILPYLVYRYLYKETVIHFKLHHGRSWYKKEIAYIFLTIIVSYFALPFMLRVTGSYHNWTVEPNISFLLVLFMGTNLFGMWDELFFVNTVLVILRRHLSFPYANFTQGIVFTSLLYELGFRGWSFLPVFLFALLQGYIFKKTDSLFYLITIHLSLDLVLYLALIHAYYPNLMPIFLIK